MGAACSAIDIVDYGFNTLRSAASCVCFIACLGPILAIVGITMIVAPNHRADNVAKYNSAITTFAPQIPTLTSTQGYVVSSPTVRMSPVSNTISISGDQSGVNSGTTVAVQSATSVYVSTLASPSAYLYIGTTGNATGNVVSGSLPQLARSGSKSYTCSYSSCGTSDITSYCTSRYSCSTSASRFCTSSSSSSSSGTSSSSSSSSSRSCTITCNYTEFLTSLCYAMSLTTTTPAKWVSSSLYNGCYYSSTSSTSFTSAQYSACTGTSNVALSFKSDLDPSFQLAIITGGTGDFGLTAGQQVALGAALLIIGLLFIGSGVALCCLARQMLQNQNNRSHMYAAFGRPPPGYVPYQTQPQLQPMMAVPPQQSYSPPTQGGYNQQPIMMQQPYGSPPYAAQQQPAQPMYGSPNAAPPVGYGAQPPPPGGYYQPPPPQQQAYPGQGGGAYYDPAYKPPNNGQFMGL